MPFDPDKYLMEKQALVAQDQAAKQAPFNPDQFLASKVQQSQDSGEGQLPPPEVSASRAAFLGGLQGLSLGNADELEAAIKSKSLFNGPEYEALRDKIRAEYKNAQLQHPTAYTAGNVAGGLTTGIASNIVAPGLGGLAATGALAGLGTSEGDLKSAEGAKQLAKDTATGTALGLGTGLVGKGLGALAKSKPVTSLAKGFKYGAEGNPLNAEAIEESLNKAATDKANLISKATEEGKQIPVGQLREGLDEQLAKISPKGSKETAALEELKKILKSGKLIEGEQALPEGAPEGLLADQTSQALPSQMSPDELRSVQKGLQALGFKTNELSGTDAAKLAQRLYGKVGEPIAENVPGVQDLNQEISKHVDAQSLLKDVSPFDVLKGAVKPSSILKKYPAQVGNLAGQAAGIVPRTLEKVPGGNLVNKATSEAAGLGGELAKQAGRNVVPVMTTGTADDVNKSNTAVLSRDLYNMPMSDLQPYADKLAADPEFTHQSQTLQKAIDDGDSLKKNQALFMLLQNPRSRALLRGDNQE